jgi:hypothetical protein
MVCDYRVPLATQAVAALVSIIDKAHYSMFMARSPAMIRMMIARLNIEHIRRILAEETDPAKRQAILRLLADEKAKLAAFEAVRPQEKKESQEKC